MNNKDKTQKLQALDDQDASMIGGRTRRNVGEFGRKYNESSY